MTTVTIELPDDTARLAGERARRAHMTLAEWIGARISGRRRLHPPDERDAMGYPRGWFERTAGSLAGVEDLQEPVDGPAQPIGALEF